MKTTPDRVEAISTKYGDHIFRLAVPHLFQVGTVNLKNLDVEAVCGAILNAPPDNHLMTPEFQADLIRCAAELAQEPVWDILKYIQTGIEISGVTVHPGIIVDFKQNATGKHIMTCTVPPDTEEETLDEVVKMAEAVIEQHLEKHGSCYGLSFTDVIDKAFRTAKIPARSIPADKTYYL